MKRARKTAVAAFDAMVLLAGVLAAGACAANDDAALLGVNLDLVAGESGKLGGQHEDVRGFVEIDRRRPAGRVVADERPELLVEREQIAQRIPPREGHDSAS